MGLYCAMFDEIEDEEDTTRLEPFYEPGHGQVEIGEMMEAETNNHKIKVFVLRIVESGGCTGWVEQIPHDGVGVQLFVLYIVFQWIGSALVGHGVEAKVVGLDHVLAEIDSLVLGCSASKGVCDGAGAAGIVQDSYWLDWVDVLFKGSRRIEKINTDPRYIT